MPKNATPIEGIPCANPGFPLDRAWGFFLSRESYYNQPSAEGGPLLSLRRDVAEDAIIGLYSAEMGAELEFTVVWPAREDPRVDARPPAPRLEMFGDALALMDPGAPVFQLLSALSLANPRYTSLDLARELKNIGAYDLTSRHGNEASGAVFARAQAEALALFERSALNRSTPSTASSGRPRPGL